MTIHHANMMGDGQRCFSSRLQTDRLRRDGCLKCTGSTKVELIKTSFLSYFDIHSIWKDSTKTIIRHPESRWGTGGDRRLWPVSTLKLCSCPATTRFDVLQSGTGSLGLYLRLIRDLETEGDGENIGRSKCDVFRGQIPKTQDPTNSSVDVSSHSHSHLHTHSQL